MPQATFDERLKSYFDRIETLEEEIKELKTDVNDIYKEAKGNGYDPKAMRAVLRLKKMNKEEREELDYLTDAYSITAGL